jgi:hypothetical protein
MVQGLWGAAAALLVVIIATAEPQASALQERVRQAFASPAPAAVAGPAESDRRADIAVDPRDDAAPLFPDLHREAGRKVSDRLPNP